MAASSVLRAAARQVQAEAREMPSRVATCWTAPRTANTPRRSPMSSLKVMVGSVVAGGDAGDLADQGVHLVHGSHVEDDAQHAQHRTAPLESRSTIMDGLTNLPSCMLVM
ncbi:hypothetical protein [Streptomyces sp. HUAS TT20]|uniref:hypothetical protein n=1 Tax=Streptomyces sp. HUAS TT20 TaxID=3447509 RepID=UPI002954B0FC|nr:hypothetical protein [Streptomyces sp. HUAS 15-9]